MNLTIGQRISTRGEDFIITNSNANYDGTWLLEAEGISELVKGKKITYHAPFHKCDRVEDYKLAWGWFEKIFKDNNISE